jgi:hypothetical protein
MTEQEYIDTTDLARLLIAKEILRDCAIFQGKDIEEASKLVSAHVARLFVKIDTQQEATDNA